MFMLLRYLRYVVFTTVFVMMLLDPTPYKHLLVIKNQRNRRENSIHNEPDGYTYGSRDEAMKCCEGQE
jgi:hypothetical protein